MTIETDVYDQLVADPDVQALTRDETTSPATYRVYPEGDVLEGVALPYIAYTTVNANRLATLADGLTDLRRARIQVTCYAKSAVDARTLGEHATDALDGLGLSGQFDVAGYDRATRKHFVQIDVVIWK